MWVRKAGYVVAMRDWWLIKRSFFLSIPSPDPRLFNGCLRLGRLVACDTHRGVGEGVVRRFLALVVAHSHHQRPKVAAWPQDLPSLS